MEKVECEIEVKSPADKFWGGIKDSTVIFPKIFSKRLQSIEVVEGDGFHVGSIRLLKYVEGTPFLKFAKERVDVLEDEDKVLVYSVIDGELTNLLKVIKVSLQVVPKNDGSLLKWAMEFEKSNEAIPLDPLHLKDNATNAFHGLDSYLIQAEGGFSI